ncbi:MAG TPA: hypothetical protein VFT53_02615 [Candidatus Saccharimonadales bacterium]|nr:hypothetical protein [Candidatus Saccharimonadales bacterium]
MNNQKITTSKSASTLHKLQILAVLILIFADGCDVGQFSLSSFDTWSIGGIINMLLHALAGFIFMACVIQLFFSSQRLASRIWVSLLSLLGVVGNIVMIIMGVTNPNPDSVGVHSPGDWMVVIAIMAGVLLWFGTLLTERVRSAKA